LNWPADNKALKRRDSLTIWLDPDMALAALFIVTGMLS